MVYGYDKSNYKTGRTLSVRREDRRPFLIKSRKAFFSDPAIPRIYSWEDVKKRRREARVPTPDFHDYPAGSRLRIYPFFAIRATPDTLYKYCGKRRQIKHYRVILVLP